MTQQWKWTRRVASMAVVLAVVPSAAIHADEWNERTILTFSAPVIVPGATLQPGKYTFKQANSNSSRQIIQIFSEQDESKLVATALTVPIKRLDPKGDVVLTFSPTATGVPPAIKSWFYPGTLYGHEFVYPEAQARQIAGATRTLVLSVDVAGNDLEKGVLRTLDPSGRPGAWQADPSTMREWEAWRQKHGLTAASVDPEERREATAAMARRDFEGVRVKLDDLESETAKYMGKTISVDGAVEDVLGPRLFTIDEAHWGDLDGEILVFMPTMLAALVQEDDRVTITGVVKPFVRTEVEKEWGWLGLDPEIEVEVGRKPILVASRIVGGDSDSVMTIDVATPAERMVGHAARPALTSVNDIAMGSRNLVGRLVDLDAVKITDAAEGRGFFIGDSNRKVFVLPAKQDGTTGRAGETVSIDGVVLEMPDGMDDRMGSSSHADAGEVYILATVIRR